MEPITEDARAERLANSQLDALDVCAKLPESAVPFTKIVGAWVWVEFNGKPDAETRGALVQLGFRWNPKRAAWQHCGGIRCKRNPHQDPREKYGEQHLSEILA